MAIRGAFKRIATIKSADDFLAALDDLSITLPFDVEMESGDDAPLARPTTAGNLAIGNRWCIHPMEGWDATTDGRPTENGIRRWQRFGLSGAKLIWGGEAVAVRPDGRANPNQLMLNADTKADIAALRQTLVDHHIQATGSDNGLVVGLQLTHSGRFCRPNRKDRLESRLAYHHPLLDPRFGVDPAGPIMSDDDVKDLIDCYIRAAKLAAEIGYDFVDIKHCHGYLLHEFLSAYDRPGEFGGSFENRTAVLRRVTEGIRAEAPGLAIGVRLSAFDMPPFKPDPERTEGVKLGPGIVDDWQAPYPGFGCNRDNPLEIDLTEPRLFMTLLRELGISLVNLSAGSPYYNPHIQRPALYPPSDGYQPPEDPLIGVARQMAAVRQLKTEFDDLCLVGSGYTYLQEYLPNVAQAAVRDGWTDSIGIGRMVLSYPDLPQDTLTGKPFDRKRVCRTFSDCTTAPRNGIVSGCYPLDPYYKNSEQAEALKQIKSGK